MQAATVALPSAPLAAATPAGHATQPPAEVVPGLVTVPKNPGAQAVQAATNALPAAPLTVVTPGGHGTQPPAPAVPGLVTAP